MTQSLSIYSCQAHNTYPLCRVLATYLSEHLGMPVNYREELDWREGYRLIVAGEIDIGWICGRPYVELIEKGAPLHLLAAPVMAGARYGDRPIYYSDVIVRQETSYSKFQDLQNHSWVYNEPGSQSGYHITCYRLAILGVGDTGEFFGRVVAGGSHMRSLAMVLSGEVDAAAIDSTVLEWEIARDPDLANRIRVIESLGPSPIPPLVISNRIPAEMVSAIRELLTTLHLSERGRAVLAVGRLSRFAVVTDADYDPIREMAAVSAGIVL